MKLLFKISGSTTIRFLVKKDGIYKTVLIPKTKNLFVGDEINESDFELQKCEDRWEQKYKKYCGSTKNIRAHLIEYKKTKPEMKDLSWGSWNKTEYEHILPESKKKLNLIDGPFYDSLLREYNKLEAKKEIHTGFANLNSSQAFALNLFVPMIENEDLFEIFLGIKDIGKIKLKEFEKVLSSEEGTQFDFYLETDKKTYTFEIKYSENAFGDTEKDEKHEIKYDSIYKERLKSVVNNLSEEEFFEEYQLWRNICFAADNKEVRFVFPEFRQDLTEIVKNAKNKCNESVKGKINYIHVEEFVTKMKSSNDENLRKHYTEFYRKYLKVL